MKRYNQICY